MKPSGAMEGGVGEAQAMEVEQLAARGDIAALIDRLAEPNWGVRRRVVGALAQLGEPAVEALCHVLSSRRESEAQIAAAVDALSASTANAEAQLIELSRHESAAVVADAAQALGRRRRTGATPRLTELTQHVDDNVAVAAIEALGRVGGRAAVDALVASAQSGNFFRTFPAIDVLGRSGDPRAIEPLAALLSSAFYAMEAARALGRTGEKAAVEPLVQLLADGPDARIRVAAIALAELLSRYAERYGLVEPVELAVKQLAPPQAAVRLAQSLQGSDDAEKTAIGRVLAAVSADSSAAALATLLDGAPQVARVAAEGLQRLGRDSEGTLADALAGGDSARRHVILPLLTRSRAVPSVVACLADPDPNVRILACEALLRLGDPSAVPALFPLLGESNPRLTQAATEAIQALGGVAAQEGALEAARSSNANVRRAAIRILAYFGWGNAVDVLLAACGDADERVRDAAINGLPYIEDPRALQGLLDTARKGDARARGMAMRALGQCGRDLRVQSWLLRGLEDTDAWVRYYACQSLGRLGTEVAAEPISALLDDRAGHVRVAAVEALSHIPTQSAGATLLQAAASTDLDVRRAALIGLGICRPPGALKLVLEASSEGDAATRLVALSALASFSGDEVVRTLELAARDADEGLRVAAVSYLAGITGGAATLALVRLLEGTERSSVLQALTLPTEGRLPGLLTALGSADDELAPVLTATLARMRRPDASSALVKVMSVSPPPARRAAATTLAALGTREALAAVRAAATADADPEVRHICSLLMAR